MPAGSAAERHHTEKSPGFPERIGDYVLIEEIGRRGMGVVFKARQMSLGRIVSLKMILRGELASAADLTRFRAEAESAARLNHPHIVPVYEVSDHDGQPYFSIKYIERTTLADRLVDGPLPPRETAALLAPVAGAIAEAHRHGVLHRDLKPRAYHESASRCEHLFTSASRSERSEPGGLGGNFAFGGTRPSRCEFGRPVR